MGDLSHITHLSSDEQIQLRAVRSLESTVVGLRHMTSIAEQFVVDALQGCCDCDRHGFSRGKADEIGFILMQVGDLARRLEKEFYAIIERKPDSQAA